MVPAVDMVTGASLMLGFPTAILGSLYKGALIAWIFAVFAASGSNRTPYVLMVIAAGVVWFAFSIVLSRPRNNLSTAISWLTRFLFAYSVLLFFLSLQPSDRVAALIFIARIWFSLIFLNQFAGLMGFGDTTYDAIGFGVSGFMFAPNQLAPTLGLSAAIVLFDLQKQGRSLHTVAIFILYATAAVSLATRLSLGLLLVTAALLFHQGLESFLRRRVRVLARRTWATITSILVGFVFLGVAYRRVLDSALGEFWASNFEANDAVWINFLLSSRNRLVSAGLDHFRDDPLRGLIVGIAYRPVEMDMIDPILTYGVFISIVIFLAIALPLYLDRRMVSSQSYGKKRFVWPVPVLFLIVLVGGGAVWGHVLFSATAAPLLFATLASACPADYLKNQDSRLSGADHCSLKGFP